MPRWLALVLFLGLSLAAPPALAGDAGPKARSGDDDVEETDVTPIAAPSGTTGGGHPIAPPRLEPTQLLGRLHPIFVHLPIGWLCLLVLFELVALVRRREPAGERYRLALLALTIASCIPTVVSGLLRADEVTREAAAASARVLLHRNLMFATCALALVALVVRLGLRGRPLEGPARVAYLALLLGAAVLLVYGAHLGGMLAYGDRYLPF